MHKFSFGFHRRRLLGDGLLRYSVVSARRNSFPLFAAPTRGLLLNQNIVRVAAFIYMLITSASKP